MPKGFQASIIGASIRLRGVVMALACLLIAYGGFALGQVRYNVFPEFAPPQVSIQTEAVGLAPEEVEALVTRPVEAAVNGASGIQAVRSTSAQGLSVVTVFFDPSSDLQQDRQTVTERLSVAAQQLPKGVGAPAMTALSSSTSTVLIAGLTSTNRSLMDVRTVADWTVRQRLLATPGVADVSVFGRDVRSIQVQVHPDALIRYGLGLGDVLATAQKATGLFPDDSKTGGETTVLPVIWEKKAEFTAALAKFDTDAAAAATAIKDEATFKTEWPKVMANCGGCHKTYRVPPKQ